MSQHRGQSVWNNAFRVTFCQQACTEDELEVDDETLSHTKAAIHEKREKSWVRAHAQGSKILAGVEIPFPKALYSIANQALFTNVLNSNFKTHALNVKSFCIFSTDKLEQLHPLPAEHRSAEHVLDVFISVSNHGTISLHEINGVEFSNKRPRNDGQRKKRQACY